jgi:hypothetical protein
LENKKKVFRYIAAATDIFTTPLNQILTSFFRHTKEDINSLYADTICSFPGCGQTTSSWVLNNTEDLIERIKTFNRSLHHSTPLCHNATD